MENKVSYVSFTKAMKHPVEFYVQYGKTKGSPYVTGTGICEGAPYCRVLSQLPYGRQTDLPENARCLKSVDPDDGGEFSCWWASENNK